MWVLIVGATWWLAFLPQASIASRAEELAGALESNGHVDHGNRTITILPQKNGMKYRVPAAGASSSMDVMMHNLNTSLNQVPRTHKKIGPRAARSNSGDEITAASGRVVNSSSQRVPGYKLDRSLIMTRPSDGTNKPDVVTFGLGVKKFLGVQFQDGTFGVDLVLTLSWVDPRAGKQVPPDLEWMSLDGEASEHLLWNPLISISNRDIGKMETISYFLQIWRNGTIFVVHRMMVKVRQPLDVRAYPFDKQELIVTLAASYHMSDEVTLNPSDAADRTFVPDTLFTKGNFALTSWEVYSFIDVDGELEKSRGALCLKVRRKWWKCVQNVLLPTILMVVVSWTVLFFPMLPSFSMPRAGSASLSLLTMATISLNAQDKLPQERAGFVWMELWNECCLNLTVIVLCINAMAEWVYHRLGQPDFATKVLDEGKLVHAIITFFILGFCIAIAMLFQGGNTLFIDHLRSASTFTRFTMIAAVSGYGYYTHRRSQELDVDAIK